MFFLKQQDLWFTLIDIQKREILKDYSLALQREQHLEVERNRHPHIEMQRGH